VRTAARQHQQNLRYRSQIKTLFKRLTTDATGDDEERTGESHRRLTALVDRAAARRAIHRNAASRKKSQAQRIVNGSKPSG